MFRMGIYVIYNTLSENALSLDEIPITGMW